MPSNDPGRRGFLLQTSALGATAVLAGLSSAVHAAAASGGRNTPATPRMPVIFIGHGSPMNAISDNGFTRRMVAWGRALPRPTAILSVSAHWLTPGATGVGIQERPKTTTISAASRRRCSTSTIRRRAILPSRSKPHRWSSRHA